MKEGRERGRAGGRKVGRKEKRDGREGKENVTHVKLRILTPRPVCDSRGATCLLAAPVPASLLQQFVTVECKELPKTSFSLLTISIELGLC